MPISLIILLGFIVLAVVVGGAALIANAQRRAVLARAGVGDDGSVSTIVRAIDLAVSITVHGNPTCTASCNARRW